MTRSGFKHGNAGYGGRIVIGLAAVIGLLLAIVGARLLWRDSNHSLKKNAAEPVHGPGPGKGGKPSVRVDGVVSSAPGTGSLPAADVQQTAPAPPAPPSEESRRLIRAVWDRGGATGPMTPEQAAAWMQNLDNIVRAGAASVPAIAEFLNAARDTFFTPDESRLLGFRSAREAVLDALSQMGGPEATSAMGAHLWPHLARPLSGEQARVQDPVLDTRSDVPDDVRTGTVHIASGNQNLVWARPADGLSPAEINRQLSLIDELLLVTGDPDGRRVLDQARSLIKLQTARPTAQAPPPE